MALATLMGCRSTKEVTKKEEPSIVTKPVQMHKLTDDELLLQRVQTINKDFKTMNCKLAVEYAGISYTGTLRLKKDNTIWISIGKFGFEAARLMFTQDSIFFINKLNSSYFKGGYGFFTSILGFRVDYSMLQSLLLGDFMRQSFSSKAAIKRQGDNVTITFPDIQIASSTRKLQQDVTFNTQTNHIEKNFVQVLNTINKLQIDYSDYILLSSINLPATLDVTLTQRDITRAQVRMSKHCLNENIDFPFSIPSKYKEMK